jgi:hypothetical protein
VGDSETQSDPGLRSQGRAVYLIECDTLLLLDRVLRSTGGVTTLSSLVAGFSRTLDAFPASSTVDGHLRHQGARRDGIDAVRPWAYHSACKCIEYIAPITRV